MLTIGFELVCKVIKVVDIVVVDVVAVIVVTEGLGGAAGKLREK